MSCGQVKGESWSTTVRPWGNTGGVTVGKKFVGKKVQITIEILD